VTEPQAGGGRSLAAVLLGWAAVAAALGYAVLVHYGVGPNNQGREWHWYTPRSFLLDVDLLYPVFESVGRALVGVGIPAAALAIAVIALCRSAVGRALALASLVAVLLFAFYGVQAPFVWNFFHWRASAVLTLMAVVVGFSLAAPWLAQSWLRLSWPLRLLVYLPIVFAVFAFVRNATGTDESLLYAISPWPAVPVFGIEVGALFVAAWLVGAGVGLRAIALPVGWPRRLAGLLLAVALPVLLLWIGSQLGLFPFRAGPRTFLGAALVTALSIAVAAAVRRGGDRLGQRARHLLVGAALIGIPLIGSEAAARYDYFLTREIRARRIIDALDSFFRRETVYPDSLMQLVESGDIDAIQPPAIGFRFLDAAKFRYGNFGTSFILEFAAPRWVECAYTPPFSEEEEEVGSQGLGDQEAQPSNPADAEAPAANPADADAPPVNPADADAAEDEPGGADEDASLGEAWSCPSKPPELW
jgi:hypothetical protein